MSPEAAFSTNGNALQFSNVFQRHASLVTEQVFSTATETVDILKKQPGQGDPSPTEATHSIYLIKHLNGLQLMFLFSRCRACQVE